VSPDVTTNHSSRSHDHHVAHVRRAPAASIDSGTLAPSGTVTGEPKAPPAVSSEEESAEFNFERK
jgi:hypothetical protein